MGMNSKKWKSTLKNVENKNKKIKLKAIKITPILLNLTLRINKH